MKNYECPCIHVLKPGIYPRIIPVIHFVFAVRPKLLLTSAFQPESFEYDEKWQVSWLPWIYLPSRPDTGTMAIEVGKSLFGSVM